jgi:hypothetical protein
VRWVNRAHELVLLDLLAHRVLHLQEDQRHTSLVEPCVQFLQHVRGRRVLEALKREDRDECGGSVTLDGSAIWEPDRERPVGEFLLDRGGVDACWCSEPWGHRAYLSSAGLRRCVAGRWSGEPLTRCATP